MTNNTVPPTEPDDLTEVLRGLLDRLYSAHEQLLGTARRAGLRTEEGKRQRAKASGVALAHDYVRAELTRIEAGAR